MRSSTHIPRDASDDQIVAIIQSWVDILAAGEYEIAATELGYALAFDDPKSACILRAIEGYRSAKFYPGVEQFSVTDWRAAAGGNPTPRKSITRYTPNSSGLAGAAEFDLPLNGRWSDLTADFVWFVSDDPEGHRLGLEEISSLRQVQQAADGFE